MAYVKNIEATIWEDKVNDVKLAPEATRQTILEAAYTGEAGDGLIFVCGVEEASRTRERGHEAVMSPGDIDEWHKVGWPAACHCSAAFPTSCGKTPSPQSSPPKRGRGS